MYGREQRAARQLKRGRGQRPAKGPALAPGREIILLGRPTSRYVVVMLALSGVLVLVLPVYVLVPQPETVRQVFYDTVAVTALILGFLGLWHHQPQQRRAWLLTLLGYSMWVSEPFRVTIRNAV